MTWWKWSQTAATNSTADSTINWAEGQSPSSVNDSARAMMAASAKYRDDIAGAIVTGGTSTAYTVTSYQVFDTLAHMNGAMIAFTPHTTNGATVTLNVDSLGAKPLRSAPSVELPSGTMVQGTPYAATYNNSDAAWYLQGFIGNPYNVPIGGFLPYVSTNVPNSSFVLPYGQAISRTTYSALFVITSTLYGSGDGSTTFNVPDLRGRAIFGVDNMGGSTASRITAAGSGITGTTLGANGGAETVTLAQSALPNFTPTITISEGIGHAHGLTGKVPVSKAGNASVYTVGSGDNGNIWGGGNGNSSTDLNTTGITASSNSINGGVTQTAVNKLPPAIMLPFILRII